MEKNSRKEKLVKQLLNKDFDVTDEDELIEMLLDLSLIHISEPTRPY